MQGRTMRLTHSNFEMRDLPPPQQSRKSQTSRQLQRFHWVPLPLQPFSHGWRGRRPQDGSLVRYHAYPLGAISDVTLKHRELDRQFRSSSSQEDLDSIQLRHARSRMLPTVWVRRCRVQEASLRDSTSVPPCQTALGRHC